MAIRAVWKKVQLPTIPLKMSNDVTHTCHCHQRDTEACNNRIIRLLSKRSPEGITLLTCIEKRGPEVFLEDKEIMAFFSFMKSGWERERETERERQIERERETDRER